MTLITNISPLGDLIIPALNNLVVKAGDSVEVPADAAASLLEQTDNWTSSKSSSSSTPDTSNTPADSIPAASN